jgi:hypothetical protein
MAMYYANRVSEEDSDDGAGDSDAARDQWPPHMVALVLSDSSERFVRTMRHALLEL